MMTENRKVTGKVCQIYSDGSMKVLLEGQGYGIVPETELDCKPLSYPDNSAFSYQSLSMINQTGEFDIIDSSEIPKLSLKSVQEEYINSLEPGDIINGRITNIEQFGVFVKLKHNLVELVHVSELSHCRVLSATDIEGLQIGDVIPLKIKEITEDFHLDLSYKDVFGDRADYSRKYNKGDIIEGIVRLETKDCTGRFIHFSPVVSGILDYVGLPKETVEELKSSYGKHITCCVKGKKFDHNDRFVGLKLDFCSF